MGLQPFADLYQGAVQVVADSIAGEAEAVGDLVGVQALVAAQVEDELLLRGQGGDGFGDQLCGFFEEHFLFRGGSSAVLEMAGQLLPIFLLACAFLEKVEDMIAGKDKEPVIECFDGRQGGAFEPEFGEDVLDEFFGGFGNLGIVESDAIEGVGIMFEKCREGLFVALGGEPEQFGFIVCECCRQYIERILRIGDLGWGAGGCVRRKGFG
jgi:hypothetical protein